MNRTIEYSAFHIGPTDVESGARIGGASPQTVKPSFQNELTRYLMTMPLANDCEISVYYSFDYFDDGPFGFHDAAYAIHDEKSPLVEVIAHKKSKRSKVGSNLSSELPGRRLILSHAKGLESSGSAGNPYPFHKQGGIPVFDKEFDSAIGAKALKLMRAPLETSFPQARLSWSTIVSHKRGDEALPQNRTGWRIVLRH